MAIQTVWSVDLGKSSLKAVKLRRLQGNVEIIAIDKVDYPVTGNGTDPQSLARDALQIFSQRNAVKEPIAISHPGQGTFSRFIKVPAFEEKKVNEMVGHEAAQQIPFPLDEVTWDFHVIDRDYLPGEEREVAIFAVRREQIDDFMLEFTTHELAVETVSIGYLGLLNFVQHDIAPEEPAIVLDIGATHTDLVLVDGNRFWIRPLPHSGNDVTKSIQDRFKIGFAEAEKLKLETAKVPQRAVKIFQAVIQPKLKELVGEIHRSIGFYRSQHGEVSFSKLYLLGNGSKIVGILKFLKESLNMPVERVQSINRFRVSHDVNVRLLKAHLPAFASTLGCGLQALGLAPCDVDLVPSEDKLQKEIDRKKKHSFFAAGIVLVAILIAGFMIGRLNDDAESAVKLAKGEYGDLTKGAKIIEKHESQKAELETIYDKVHDLAELRRRMLGSLQALDQTLTQYPENQLQIVSTLPQGADSEASINAIRERLEESLFRRVWVPSFELERTTHTYPVEADSEEDEAGSGGDEDDSGDSTSDEPKTVPAYRFRVQVMVTKRNSQKETVDFARGDFGKKLAKFLADGDVTVVPDPKTGNRISVGVPTTDLVGLEPLASGRRGSDDEGQEGNPFDSVEVSWLVVDEPPPVKAESFPDGDEEAGGEGGDDGDDGDGGDDGGDAEVDDESEF